MNEHAFLCIVGIAALTFFAYVFVNVAAAGEGKHPKGGRS